MLPREEVLKAILDIGVLAIIRLDNSSQFQTVRDAIRTGGIRAIEITFLLVS